MQREERDEERPGLLEDLIEAGSVIRVESLAPGQGSPTGGDRVQFSGTENHHTRMDVHGSLIHTLSPRMK